MVSSSRSGSGLVDRRDPRARLDVLPDVDHALADDPVERGADARVAEELGGALLLRLGRGRRPLLRGALRRLPVELGLRDGARLEQVLHPPALALRLLQLLSARPGLRLRCGRAERRRPRVERRDDLPALHGLAALDERLHDLAARVGGDVRLAARVQAARSASGTRASAARTPWPSVRGPARRPLLPPP